MRLFKKGQGATEYLLMLAAVLVIVAIAVYYITTTAPGGVAPTATITLKGNVSGAKVGLELTKISTDVKTADWKYAVWEESESQPGWADASGSLKVGTYELTIGGTETGADKTYNVWVYHVPTKSVMFKGTVEKTVA